MHKAILTEHTVETPIMRINSSVILNMCHRVLLSLFDSMGRDVNVRLSNKSPSLHFDLVDGVLEKVTQHAKDDTKGHVLNYWRPLKITKAVLGKVDLVRIPLVDAEGRGAAIARDGTLRTPPWRTGRVRPELRARAYGSQTPAERILSVCGRQG